MAEGRMNPLDTVGWRQDGAGDSTLTLTNLDAVASKNDKALCSLARAFQWKGW
jgi:hypothetical protein